MKKNDFRRAAECLPLVTFSPFLAFGAALCYMMDGAARIGLLVLVAALFALAVLRQIKYVRVALAGAFSGVLIMAVYIFGYCDPLYAYDGEIMDAECYVTERYSVGEGICAYTAEVSADGREFLVSMVTEDSADVCDTIHARIRLKKQNDSYYFSQGIIFKATVQEVYSVSRGVPTLKKHLDDYRGYLSDNVQASLGAENGSLAAAMLLGDKSVLSPEMKQYAQVCGVSHYTAVSGMHFVLCLWVMLYFVGSTRVRLLKPAVALLVVPVMVLFFGAGASVIRAGIMAAMCNLAYLIGRKPCTVNSLCVTLMAVIIAQPNAVMDGGFIMSVLGVFGAGVVAPEINEMAGELLVFRSKKVKALAEMIITSACAMVSTAPVSIALFGGVSLAGPVITVLLTPLFTAAMVIMVLYGVSGGVFSILLLPLSLCAQLMRMVIECFGSLHSLWLPMAEVAAVLTAISVAAIVVALLMRENRSRPLMLCVFCMFATVIISVVETSAANEILLLSNGSSGAAIFRSGRTASVLVAGDGAGLGEDIESKARLEGITVISAIVAQDLTYSGALSLCDLVESYAVPCVYTNEDTAEMMSRYCDVITEPVVELSYGDNTIAAANVNDDVSADIVLYYGYKLSAPQNDATTALYCSSRQTVLPENGYNIYHDEYTIPIYRERKE